MHADARDNFHNFARMILHPDACAPGCNAKYPNCRPSTARRRLFGEVMSGMMTEALDFAGDNERLVPVFRNQENVQWQSLPFLKKFRLIVIYGVC